MGKFTDLADLLEKAATALREADAKLISVPSTQETSVFKINFSVRVRKGLNRLNVTTVEQLCRLSALDFEDVKNFGPVALQEVRDKLKKYGLGLKGEAPLT